MKSSFPIHIIDILKKGLSLKSKVDCGVRSLITKIFAKSGNTDHRCEQTKTTYP